MTEQRSCTACGAKLEPDHDFCEVCYEPGPERTSAHVETTAEEEAESPTRSLVWIVVPLLAIVVGVLRLNQPGPKFEYEVIDVQPPDRGPGAEVVRAKPASRALAESERAVVGSWVSLVEPRAVDPTSVDSMMAGMAAIKAGAVPTMPQPCTWLELYDNLTGFAFECVIVNGEPSVFERTNAMGTSKSTVGVAFSWSFDDRLHLVYETPLRVTATDGTATTIGEAELRLVSGQQIIEAEETFPGHPELGSRSVPFEIFPGRFSGESKAD